MFARILLATDFSDQAENAYPWAAQMARASDGVVLLVHALENDLVSTTPVFAGFMPPEALDVGSYREQFRTAALRALDAAAEKVKALGVRVETHLLEGGKPSVAIVDAAKELDGKVIVLSTHGRVGLAHLLLGSTAEKVVRSASCPVLSVHQDDAQPQG